MKLKVFTMIVALCFVLLLAGQCNSQRLNTAERVRATVLPQNAKIVCVGDSVTAQYVPLPPATHNYVQALDVLLRTGKAPEARVTSAGVGGNTSAHVVARFDKDVLSSAPDLIVVLIGINDVHQFLSVEAYTQNLQTIVDRTRQALPQTKLLFVAPFLIARSGEELVSNAVTKKHWDLLPEFIDAMRESGRKNKVPFLNLHDEFQTALQYAPASYFCDESVHPAENGKIFIAQRIMDAIEFKKLKGK